MSKYTERARTLLESVDISDPGRGEAKALTAIAWCILEIAEVANPTVTITSKFPDATLEETMARLERNREDWRSRHKDDCAVIVKHPTARCTCGSANPILQIINAENELIEETTRDLGNVVVSAPKNELAERIREVVRRCIRSARGS